MDKYYIERTAKKEDIEEDMDDLFQYEALIEQLKVEKSDYINKCKKYSILLNEIYSLYKEKWGLSAHKPLEKMNFNELEEVFKIKQ